MVVCQQYFGSLYSSATGSDCASAVHVSAVGRPGITIVFRQFLVLV